MTDSGVETTQQMVGALMKSRLFVVTALVLVLAACGSKTDTAAPMATPTVTGGRGWQR